MHHTKPFGFRLGLYPLIPVFLLVQSCTSVRLIQEYDETTDRKITLLQEKFARFFVRMQKLTGQPEAAFGKFDGFYEDVRTELNVLEVRSRAIPKSSTTLVQLESLEDQLDNMEQLHRIGVSDAREWMPVQSALESSFTALLKYQMALKNRIKP